MPNTEMAKQMDELGIRPQDMATGYFGLAPTLANALIYLLATLRPPRALFEWWIRKARPYHEEQTRYPRLNQLMRALYFARRGIDHLRQMDFAHTPGRAGFVLYKLGVIRFWKKHLVKEYSPPREPAALPPSLPSYEG